MKKYEAPRLFVDSFAADTMIASSPKNDNAGNNQNCWGLDCVAGQINGDGDVCLGDTLHSDAC